MNKKFPIVGSGGMFGGGGGNAKSDPNSLRSKATAKIVDLLGEGEIRGLVNGGKSIYLDQTPLLGAEGQSNFKGLVWTSRNGLPDQTHIEGFAAVEGEISVSTKVLQGTPVVRAINDPDLDAIKVTVRVPALYVTDEDDGTMHRTSVQYRIEVQYNGGSWIDPFGVITIEGKAVGAYDQQKRINLPMNPSGTSHPWNVRVTRITANNDDEKTQNDLYFASYTTVIDSKFSYPNSALVALAIDGEQFGQSVPNRRYEVYGRIIRVPVNYDPLVRTYTGIWNGTFKWAWTDNPAWVFFDVLTNDRFGLGEFIDLTQVDKWSLYQIAQYCDEQVPDGYGGFEPRFSFNGVLSTQQEAYNALQSIASAFRGMAFWSSGTVMATQDRPRDPDIIATPANVIGGIFTYQSSSLKARHTVAIVEWADPAARYDRSYEPVYDNNGILRYGYNETRLTAVGCTSRAQAHRYGEWALFTELNETQVVTYQAGMDHAGIRPGDVVAVQDPNIAMVEWSGRLRHPFNAYGGNFDFLTGQMTLNGVSLSMDQLAFARAASGDAQNLAGDTITFPPNEPRLTDRGLRIVSGVDSLIIPLDTYDPSGEDPLYYNLKFTFDDGSTQTVENVAYGSVGSLNREYITHLQVVLLDAPDENLQSTVSTLYLDAPVTFASGKTYTVSVLLPTGEVEEKGVNPQAVGVPVNSIVLSEALSAEPAPGTIWLLAANDLKPQRFKVVSVREVEPHIYEISGTQQEPTKFDHIDFSAEFDPAPIMDSPGQEPPINLTLAENLTTRNGVPSITLTLSWEQPKGWASPIGYLVSATTPEGEVDYGRLGSVSLAISNASAGDYVFRVSSINVLQQVSVAATLEYTTQGWKDLTPPTVSGLVLVNAEAGEPTKFYGRDIEWSWYNSFTDEMYSDEETNPFFAYNTVKIYDQLTNQLLRTETVLVPHYTYTLDNNIKDNRLLGREEASRLVRIDVTITDIFNRTSDILFMVAENEPPELLSYTAQSYPNLIIVKWGEVTDPDYAGVLVWLESTSGYDPEVVPPQYVGVGNSTIFSVPDGVYYLRVAAFDHFSRTDINISAETEVTVSASGDLVPPEVPTGLTLTTETTTVNGVVSRLILRATVGAAVDGDFAYFEWEIKEASGNYLSYTSPSSTYEWSVLPETLYSVKVRGVDASNNLSSYAAVETITTPAVPELADLINAGTSAIDAGSIVVSGSTLLSDWRRGGDETRIDGGAISANTISANKLTVGNRSLTLEGMTFTANSPVTNQVAWSAGDISYISDAGTPATVAIAAGNSATWAGGTTIYVYWVKAATSLSTTTVAATAFAENNVVLATYRGGIALTTDYGRTIIDGGNIKTGTVTAVQMSVSSLSAINANLGSVTAGVATSTNGKMVISLDTATIIMSD